MNTENDSPPDDSAEAQQGAGGGCLARLVLALRRWRRKHLRTMDEVVTDMVYDFKETFPGKCMICSYHRFGRDHGMTREPEPAPHDCIDSQNS